MKWAALAATVFLLGAGWLAVTMVGAEEATPGSAAPAAAPAPAPAPKPPDVTPPPPVPEVEVPPIPEVGENPFEPGPPPVRVKPADVIEEGKRLFNREGRLDVDAIGRSRFMFDSGDKPMRLLECSLREKMEKNTDQGSRHMRWRISGLVTVYGGENYLLLTKVVPILGEEEKL